MATVIEPRTADQIEEDLIRIDQGYCTLFGSDMTVWPRGVRHVYMDVLEARHLNVETRPVHPRKTSARRRRRNGNRLAFRIHEIAPGAVTVLLTSVPLDESDERAFQARAMDACGAVLQLPEGGSRRLAELVQGAFPIADWDRPQTWHADSNRLTTWGQASRNFRDSDDAGYVESLDMYTARLGGGA